MRSKFSADVRAFWDAYIHSLSPEDPARDRTCVADHFGDSPALADTLCDLILRGVKTATCSTVWEWNAEGTDVPRPGFLQVVLDGTGTPRCIIETTEVSVTPFDRVDAHFAAAEGEGDRSHAYWRDAHWRYFSRVLPAIGRTAAPDMPLVCERFRVVYPPEACAVRRATAADIPLLVTLMSEFYAESEFTLNPARATQAFDALLASDERGFVLLVRDGGNDVGHLVVTFGFSMEYGGLVAVLDDLYVRPHARGAGAAGRALAAMRAECAMRGIRAVHVETAHDNGRATAAYRRAGFEPVERAHLTLRLAEPTHDP